MRHLTIVISLFLFHQTYGQKKECFCSKDTLMNTATINCKTTILKNKSKLYWQFNCDRIWLTFENPNGKKRVIDEVPVDLYGYTYRLGYTLIKEFKNSLLFRSGCSANGPCIYTLVDKTNGNKIKKFNQLICIDTDVQFENPHKYNYDFVVYFSRNYDHLIVYFADSNRTYSVPFKDNLTGVIPENEFNRMTLKNNVVTLYYETEKSKRKTVSINLQDKKYSR